LLGKKYLVTQDKDFDFAAIVTAHQDTRFIKPFIDSFVKQTYNNFIVYVVADDCETSDLTFTDKRIKILKPEIPFHAKIKSIKYAVDSFEREHEVLVVQLSTSCLFSKPEQVFSMWLYSSANAHAIEKYRYCICKA
jgi:hypothetical protein